jgi:hypothetical protein
MHRYIASDDVPTWDAIYPKYVPAPTISGACVKVKSVHTGGLNLGGGKEGAYFDLARSVGPYFVKTKGMGVIARAMKPSREDAHSGPSFTYIWVANN